MRTAIAAGVSIAMAVALAPVVAAAPAPPPTIGDSRSLLTFDDGGTGAVFAWGSDATSTPALSTVDADVPGTGAGNKALQAAVQDVPAGGWSGYSLDINTAANWSAYDGFAFEFLGTASGKTLRYELKSGGSDAGSAHLFQTSVLDYTAGWRTVRVDFGALRLKGDPGSNLRFDPTEAHGFAVTLSELGAGNWQFDEFALYQRSSVIEDFEGEVPIGSDTNPIGWFTWGNRPGNATLGVSTRERDGNPANHVLSGEYLIPGGGYGGISLDLATSEDWSAYGAISFYWYAPQPTKPASPTAGADIAIEIKDGGPDAEHSELWTTTFKDNWSADGDRWKLVTIPFSQFELRTDYQPGSGDTLDGAFSRTDAWGFAITFPAGTVSGATQQITVSTRAADHPDVSRSIVIALTPTGAQMPADNPMVVINTHGLPYLDPTLPVAQRVSDLLGRMTQAEKIGQMTQAERLGLTTPATVTELGLGSVLSGGGSVPKDNTATGWADMVDGFQRQALATRLQVPIIYGVDAVHGHNNVVGATLLPHNIGLGASRDPALIEAGGRMTATEVRATGIPWTFAPCLCVTRDERWGRSYEAFSEDTALVTQLARPAIVGLQGSDPTNMSAPDKVLATAKHWAGDGGTRYEPALAGSGYPIDQGVTHADSLMAFEKLFVTPYQPAIDAGVGSIMPSYSGVQIGDGPVIRMHEYAELNTDLLKNTMGFKGFLISDWEGINKLPGNDYADKAARSVNSGLDMAMAPYDYAAFITAITDKAAAGVVKQSRIDDAVRRILTEKFELGLFETPFADRSEAGSVGSPAHRAVARTAAAETQVLIKNTADVLPLNKNAKIYLAGSNADDLGNQMGGWSISWQGASGATTVGTTIRQGIEQVAPGASVTYSKDASAPTAGNDVGIVVVGETPYAEGVGDVGNNGHTLDLSTADRTAIDTVCSQIQKCVVLVVSGRPQLVTDKLGEIDALVASWLPGTEGAGVADVLFGDRPFTGRLPVTWPASADQVPINVGDADYAPLFPYGWGLRTGGLYERIAGLQQLAAGSGVDQTVRSAVKAALAPGHWLGTTLRHPDPVIAALGRTANRVAADGEPTAGASGAGPNSLSESLTSIIRDLVQQRVLSTSGTPTPRVSTLIAGADHSLASGDAVKAVVQLLSAWKAVS